MGITGRNGKRPRNGRLLCLVPMLGLLVWTALPAQQQSPLSRGDVLELIAAGVPGARLATLVEERGVGFEMTPETAEELRKAGASEELLVALRFAAKLRKEHAAQPPATLNIESEPGSADIYLNDEPKGTTSHEGKLRLAGLAPGTHRLRVFAKGYETWERNITMKAGEIHTMSVNLVLINPEAPPSPQPKKTEVAVAQSKPSKSRLVGTESIPDLLCSAKTLCIVLGSDSSFVIKTETSKVLLRWGKLTLVSSPEEADLILRVEQTGRLNTMTGAGNQAAAVLKAAGSDVDLWSTTKGGSWAMSGWSNAWVGRAIAKEFIKFFESTKPSKTKK